MTSFWLTDMLSLRRDRPGKASPAPRVDDAPHDIKAGVAVRGRVLDDAPRREMEARFGENFSHVRVHTDTHAAESAAAIDAAAYTVGSDIVFGSGRYSPGSAEGKRLLAHELTHVMQQTRGGNAASSVDDDRPAELEAHVAARNAAAGKPVSVSESRAPRVARQPLSDEEKIRKSLGLAPDADAGKPKTIWLGPRPTWFQDKPETPIVWVGQKPSQGLKQAVETARSTPAPKREPLTSLLPPPRTAFEARAFKTNMRRIKDQSGAIIGFFAEEGGVYRVYDIEGKATIVGEKPLESPLLDPIDLIPFELLGSLAVKAATIAGRTALKTGARFAGKEAVVVGAEDLARVGVRDVTKAGARDVVTAEAESEGAKALARGGDEFDAFKNMLREEGVVGEVRAGGDLVKLGEHGAATQNRQALGVSGRQVQSAHGLPQSVGKGVLGYNPKHALTRLMDRDVHTAMDRFWKETFQNMRRAGQTQASAQRVYDVVAESIRRAPGIPTGEKNSLIARLADEIFVESGLKPTDLLDLPYPNIKP